MFGAVAVTGEQNRIIKVLGHYSKEEEKLISEGAKHAAEAVLCYLDDGFNKAMNKFN